MYFNRLIGQGKMKRKYITASISSNYQWILDARAKYPSSYLFFIKHSSTKEAINFPRWKQLRKAQAVMCAVEIEPSPWQIICSQMHPTHQKLSASCQAQGFFPDVGHPAGPAIIPPTASAPWDMQILPPCTAASEKGTPHYRPAPVSGHRGEEMSVCAHVMLQDTCTQLCNGRISRHTQRSRWSLVTQPGTTKETPHGEQSWRRARVRPCGERLHLSN